MRMHSGENKSRDQCILRDRFHFLFIQRNSLLGIQICVCHRSHPLRLMGIMLIRNCYELQTSSFIMSFLFIN